VLKSPHTLYALMTTPTTIAKPMQIKAQPMIFF
jgi:hypothetical protein